MANDNMISVEFTAQEIADIAAAIQAIKTIVAPKAINLTPNERHKFARVSYEMEYWTQNVHNYMVLNPILVPPYINLPEHEKDIKARNDMRTMLNGLKEITEMLDDTRLLLGTDVYNNSIAFYRNVKISALQNVPGSTNIYQDLQQQFPGRPKKKIPPTP
ncbi:MAG: hypothetical protein A2X12_03245 [Bacteroidetes bacterium GWE2_29_8]|nr:MAG: hypothetical protein A2X12_03245 [Bacteroidetes bacterium GWE2_29_8]OFY19931.1 MAG: hypothetical protein A2X02_08715 [Bacteroidetes bacterium GWF2_29_10]